MCNYDNYNIIIDLNIININDYLREKNLAANNSGNSYLEREKKLIYIHNTNTTNTGTFFFNFLIKIVFIILPCLLTDFYAL